MRIPRNGRIERDNHILVGVHSTCVRILKNHGSRRQWRRIYGVHQSILLPAPRSWRWGAAAERDQHREHSGPKRVLSDDAPPFSDLLTIDWFLHCATLVKRQATAFFSHPLSFEILRAANLFRAELAQRAALQWMKRVNTANGDGTSVNSDEDEVLSVMVIPVAWAHGGSSTGNARLLPLFQSPILTAGLSLGGLDLTHPLSTYSSIPHPVKAGYVHPPSPSVTDADTSSKRSQSRAPGYISTRVLWSFTSAQLAPADRCIRMFFYDRNVFEDGVAKGWLDESRGRYCGLGQTHQSRWARQSHGGGDKLLAGSGEYIRAKLWIRMYEMHSGTELERMSDARDVLAAMDQWWHLAGEFVASRTSKTLCCVNKHPR